MEPKQGTHWDGCYEVHPDCAAYREGYRAGMRAAAALEAELTRGYYDHAKGPYIRYRDAILSEADKP